MEIISDFKEGHFEGQGIVTIGTFDGVHLGHQKILKRLAEVKEKKGGKTIAFTFDPHPRKILFPNQNDLQLLNDLNEKTELLRKAGVDFTVVYPFTNEFSQIEPEKFIREILVEKLNTKILVIGYDHKFGKNRSGNIETFKNASKLFGFEVEEIPAQEINEINISSTKIRKALFEGDVKTAAQFLGFNYFLSGKVVHGKKLGRSIGIPTVNLKVENPDKLIPAKGVYCVGVEVNVFKGFGMMNIGTNPTIDNTPELKLEVNIFNFEQNIYNKSVKIEFIERVRDEKKFNSIEELIEAIKNDEKFCKNLIKYF